MIDINVRAMDIGFRIDVRDDNGRYQHHDRSALPESLAPAALYQWLLAEGFQAGILQGPRAFDVVRLRLPAHHRGLHQISWESIQHKTGPLFAADADTPFVRTTFSADQRTPRPMPEGPLRLLAAVAQASDLPPFDAQNHLAQISSGLDAKTCEIISLTTACTADNLRQAIVRHRPQILHLSAHGEVSERGPLIYLDEGPLSANDLGFDTLEHPPHLVFLATCHSAAVDDSGRSLAADIFEHGVDHVVAMSEAVKVATALPFAAALYADLAAGETLAAAVNAARRRRLALDDRQAALPVCYSLAPDQPWASQTESWRHVLRRHLDQQSTQTTYARALHLKNHTAHHRGMHAYERDAEPVVGLHNFWEQHPRLLLTGPNPDMLVDKAVTLARKTKQTALLVDLKDWHDMPFNTFLIHTLTALLDQNQATRLIQDGEITPIIHGFAGLTSQQRQSLFPRLDTWLQHNDQPTILCCDDAIQPTALAITKVAILPEAPDEFMPTVDHHRLHLHIHDAFEGRHRIIMEHDDTLTEGFINQTHLNHFDQCSAQERFDYVFQSQPLRQALLKCLSKAAHLTLLIQLDPELPTHLPWTNLQQPDAFAHRRLTTLRHVSAARQDQAVAQTLRLNILPFGQDPAPVTELHAALQGLENLGLDRHFEVIDQPKPLNHMNVEDQHILHLMGHCHLGHGRLILHDVDPHGEPKPHQADELTTRIRQAGSRAPVVILITPTKDTAGWLALAPQLIESGVGAVIIDTHGACDAQSYRRLYRRLARRATLDDVDIDHRFARFVAHRDAHTFAPSQKVHDLQHLIQRVREFWIHDHFERRVTETGFLELPWTSASDFIQAAASRPLDPFDDAHAFIDQHRATLITGPSGSGKTFLMLRLVRAQLELAEQQNKPVPVVFTMASWPEQPESLDAWMVHELVQWYKIPKKDAEAIIDRHEIFPIFDGLDEIALTKQKTFVHMLNAYRQDGHPAIVCARDHVIKDLAVQEHHLHLTTAIQLSYPQKNKVQAFLNTLGAPVQSLRKSFATDTNVQELLNSPLMLFVAISAFWNRAINFQADRKNLLNAFCVRLAKREFLSKSKDFSPEKCLHWLHILAFQMKWHDQNAFLIERLQPVWLGDKNRLLYIFTTRFLLILSLAFLVVGTLPHMLFVGIAIGTAGLIRPWLKFMNSKTKIFLFYFSISAVVNIIIEFVIFHIFSKTTDRIPIGNFELFIFNAPSMIAPSLVVGMFIAYRTGEYLSNDIIPIEKIDWSIQALWPGVFKSLPIGLIMGLSAWIMTHKFFDIFFANTEFFSHNRIFLSLLLVFGGICLYTIIGGIITGRRSHKIKLDDNGMQIGSGLNLAEENMIQSAKVFAIFGSSLMLLLTILGITYHFLYDRELIVHNELNRLEVILAIARFILFTIILFFILLIGTLVLTFFIGSFGALWWGGWSLIQHWTLRFLLEKEKRIPRNLTGLLDTSIAKGFMKRNGAACAFFHLELRDHLAETDSHALIQALEQS